MKHISSNIRDSLSVVSCNFRNENSFLEYWRSVEFSLGEEIIFNRYAKDLLGSEVREDQSLIREYFSFYFKTLEE